MNAKEVTNPIDMAPVTSEDGENENNKAAAENERVDDMEQKDQDAFNKETTVLLSLLNRVRLKWTKPKEVMRLKRSKKRSVKQQNTTPK